jgi:hypothetical protein
MGRLKMKFNELILMICEQTKMVPKIRGGKNKSHKCETAREFLEAINEIKEDGHDSCTIIVDPNNEIIYIVGRTSFHRSLANEWNLSDKDHIHLTGTISDRGFSIDQLQMSELARKKIKEMDSKNWIKGFLRTRI